MKRVYRKYRKVIWLFSLLFALVNALAISHAWHFTHFTDTSNETTRLNEDGKLNDWSRLLFGISNPKPTNREVDRDFIEVDTVYGARQLEIWKLDMEPSKGLVLLFHGYRSSKSSMLREAMHFYRLGYSAILVDFRGSGGSEGNETSIGYYEAEDVEAVVEWTQFQYPKQKLFLYGMSMGAVAVMRALSDLNVTADGLILQSPYSNLRNAVGKRFELMGLPQWPGAAMLTFWGGFIQGFNGYNLDTYAYAKNISTPVLLIHGKKDNRVSWDEIARIYDNLSGEKEVLQFDNSGHESILNHEEDAWLYTIKIFLKKNN